MSLTSSVGEEVPYRLAPRKTSRPKPRWVMSAPFEGPGSLFAPHHYVRLEYEPATISAAASTLFGWFLDCQAQRAMDRTMPSQLRAQFRGEGVIIYLLETVDHAFDLDPGLQCAFNADGKRKAPMRGRSLRQPQRCHSLPRKGL